MLNKLSFNIFNELNESESETYKIKKRVLIESNGVTINDLNENKSVCEKCGKEPCECNKTLNEDNEVVLPYEPKVVSKVEIYHNGELVEASKYSITNNTVAFTELVDGDEVIIMPFEFEMPGNDEYKEIVIRADQFPTAGKLVLKGVEKNKSAENYKDLTIIIDKAQPASDFSLSTSSEVDATETEIKLSALVDNGRLMRVIEGKTIDKDNGIFTKL